jgi:hypothetical protein
MIILPIYDLSLRGVATIRFALNPNKCSFCVTSGCLLGFIMSTKGIMVDPLKVEAIVQFPPPCTIPQLQSLQGKANFLRRFVANYAEITKGFMCLLKKGVPFCWDEVAQCSFEALKCALTSAPLLSPPDYGKDFLLYLALQSLLLAWSWSKRMMCSKSMLSTILVEA